MYHLVAQDNFNVYAHFVGRTLEECEHLAAWWLMGLIHREWKLNLPEVQTDARHLAALFEQGKHAEVLKWFEKQGQLVFSSHHALTFHQLPDVQRFLPAEYWLRPREAVRSLLQSGYAMHQVSMVNGNQVEVSLQVPAVNREAAERLALQGLAAHDWRLASDHDWYRVDFAVYRTDHHHAEVWVKAGSSEEAADLASLRLGVEHLTGQMSPGEWDFGGEVLAVNIHASKESQIPFHPAPPADLGPWLLTYTHQNVLHGPLFFEDRLEALGHLRDWVFKSLPEVPLSLSSLQDCPAHQIDERVLIGVELAAPWSHSLVPVKALLNR